ncbi:beta-galactosidase [Dactylosporangium sp. CA-052675]|uniref:beta-galactosidase n=1 Tax=Dactylosporangium sp. CA-052675 TaxID=3239927 RepID=UPI003D8B38C5
MSAGYPFGYERPVIYGEYPYYRADPDRWGPNLAALAEAGVDVVTCYVPWRFHEYARHRYDFRGAGDKQRDLLRLLDLAAAAGLRVLLKPGPFIHAEVQLGGLPDRVSPTVDPRFAAVLDAGGRAVTSQGLALPSLFCPLYREEVRHWLGAVERHVLATSLAPHGPVVAVQLGNEGIYSDANQPVTAHDFSAPAVAAFLHDTGRADAGDPSTWSAELREAWAEHSGTVLRRHYLDLAEGLSPAVRQAATLNLPLPALDGPPGGAAAWLLRTAPLAGLGFALGYTGWVGSVARSRIAFASHWFGVRARRYSNVEDNWGFTWTDPAFDRPGNAMFQALLALALESRTYSVYTACATEHWTAAIDLDAQALLAEGIDPLDYAPPYCPGAPLREDGGTGANIAALHALRDVVRSAAPRPESFGADVALLVPSALARAEAWPEETAPAGPALRDAAELCVELMERQQYQIEVLTEEHAEDSSLPWLVPVGPDGPGERLARLIRDHRRAGHPVVLLTGAGGAPRTPHDPLPMFPLAARDRAPLLRMLPAARHAHPATDPAVVLVHTGPDGTARSVFVFNLGAEHATVRRAIGGDTVSVEVPPRSAALLRRTGDRFSRIITSAELDPPPPPPPGIFATVPASIEESP